MTSVSTTCSGDPHVSVVGPILIEGVAGCDGAVYEVTYIARDACDRTASCVAQYNIANDGPQITESAPDRVVECSFDILPEPELIVALSDCNLELEVAYSDPQLISGDGTCDGEYEIIYTVSDACGRTAEASQFFIIQNEAPRVIPPDPITISCLEELNELDVNDAEMIATCNIPIVKTEIIGPIYNETEPLCDGSIINILYSATDACGRMTCEPQIVFIELNENTLTSHFPNITVACNEVPTAENTNDLCGFEKLSFVDEEKIVDVDSYEIWRTYTAEDACENVFEYTQIITVTCGTSAPSREFCTLDVEGWTDWNQIESNPKFANIELNHLDPLFIGAKGHRVIFTDFKCLPYLLQEAAEASTFKHEDLELYVSSLNDCGREVLNVSDEGLLNNALFNNMIALELNMRADNEFEHVLLLDICLDWDPAMLQKLGENPTIKDLAIFGNEALAEDWNMDYELLAKSIADLLNYFKTCRPAACDEPGIEGYIDNGQLDIEIPDFSLNLYPNPTVDFININLDKRKGQFQLLVYNAVGHLIYQNEIGEKIDFTIDVRKWKTGMYHVGLTLDGIPVKTEQVIIAKD